ncbi:MAG: hypothetical protein KKD28_14045 [Chloroflexi bacterium]|nr:hypothetical protein [Chloroflexota bacterium]
MKRGGWRMADGGWRMANDLPAPRTTHHSPRTTLTRTPNQMIPVSARRLWFGRALIGAVIFTNVQCAIAFLRSPTVYAPWYELQGAAGEAAIRGFGVLFLMWNVPYVVALIYPHKQRTSLYEAIIMQTIGIIGEAFILWWLPIEYTIARGSIVRFIIFDGGGLIALLLAAWVCKSASNSKRGRDDTDDTSHTRLEK